MPHMDTSVAINQAINPALNATQGHKRSYQPSYYSSSKCHTVTPALAIYQALCRSLPYNDVSSQPKYSTVVQLLYTVIKAKFSISHDLKQIMLRITAQSEIVAK